MSCCATLKRSVVFCSKFQFFSWLNKAPDKNGIHIYIYIYIYTQGWGVSNEYPQHVFVKNWRKLSHNYHQILFLNNFSVYTCIFLFHHEDIWAWGTAFTCAPSEDSDQPAHLHILIRVLVTWRRFESLAFVRMCIRDSDQTARMHKLIRVFPGCTCNLLGNAVPWLICYGHIKNISKYFYCSCDWRFKG